MTQSKRVWEYKPWWCQPWSIILTSVTVITASWFLFKLVWLTILVAIPMMTWMVFFVGIYPKLFEQALEEQAK